MAKRFMYVCLGVVALMIAFTLSGITAPKSNPAGNDIAIASGELYHGDTIPLPVYCNGDVAQESECAWMVSYSRTHGFANIIFHGIECYTVVRQVYCQAHYDGSPYSSWVNYIIIAARDVSDPSPTTQTTWGHIKAAFGE